MGGLGRSWRWSGCRCGWGVVRRTPLDGALALFFGVLRPQHARERPRRWRPAGGYAPVWLLSAYFARLLVATRRASTRCRLARCGRLGGRRRGRLRRLAALHRCRLVPRRCSAGRPGCGRGRRAPRASRWSGFFRNYLTFAHAMMFPLAWARRLALRGRILGMVARRLARAGDRVLDGARACGSAARCGARARSRCWPAAGAAFRLLGSGGAGGRRWRSRCRPDCAARPRRSSRSSGANAGRVAIYRAEPRHRARPSGARARLRALQGRRRGRTTIRTPRPTAGRTRTATSCRWRPRRGSLGPGGVLSRCFAVVLRRGWEALRTAAVATIAGRPRPGRWVGHRRRSSSRGSRSTASATTRWRSACGLATAILLRCARGLKPRMDVLHVDPERGWGGGEVQVLSLLRELGARAAIVRDARGRSARPAGAGGGGGRRRRSCRCAIRNHVDVAAGLRLRRLVARPRRRPLPHGARARDGAVLPRPRCAARGHAAHGLRAARRAVRAVALQSTRSTR